MRDFSLRSDVERAVVDGFALPLGIEPGDVRAPNQGYTLAYTAGRDDGPDTYSFHVVVSHERLRPILGQAFRLLPAEVHGIVEIGSRDAYRSVDVYVAKQSVSREDFLATWQHFEPFLIEDGSIAAGANADEPAVEVFLDQWKGLSIHVPLPMREDVEGMLHGFGLEEVAQTWPIAEDFRPVSSQVRPVLQLVDEYSPDVDEVLLHLRHAWKLDLNIDPETNTDEGGRDLGLTLWCAVVIVDSADGDPDRGAYAEVWASAGSLSEMEELVTAAIKSKPQWVFSEIYTIDRVAYDERPDELADLPPRQREPQVHLLHVDPWTEPPSGTHGV